MVSLAVACAGSPLRYVLATAFPFRIGRAASGGLAVAAPGVWEEHAVLQLDPEERCFRIAPVGEATVIVNGTSTNGVALRNGDTIDLGACRLTFALAPAVQKRLTARQWATWALLGMVMTLEVWLFLRLN